MPMTDEDAALARNLGTSRALLAILAKAECDPSDAIAALLTTATALIENRYSSDLRLEALNALLAPTIQEWARQRGPVVVTLQ